MRVCPLACDRCVPVRSFADAKHERSRVTIFGSVRTEHRAQGSARVVMHATCAWSRSLCARATPSRVSQQPDHDKVPPHRHQKALTCHRQHAIRPISMQSRPINQGPSACNQGRREARYTISARSRRAPRRNSSLALKVSRALVRTGGRNGGRVGANASSDTPRPMPRPLCARPWL